MVENVNVKEPKDAVLEVKEEVKPEEKRFNLNVEAGLGKIFTFSGPEQSNLGLIYDAAYKVLVHVSNTIQERVAMAKPKVPPILEDEKENTGDKKEEK